jgi:hypothetical protein
MTVTYAHNRSCVITKGLIYSRCNFDPMHSRVNSLIAEWKIAVEKAKYDRVWQLIAYCTLGAEDEIEKAQISQDARRASGARSAAISSFGPTLTLIYIAGSRSRAFPGGISAHAQNNNRRAPKCFSSLLGRIPPFVWRSYIFAGAKNASLTRKHQSQKTRHLKPHLH